jgi:hypothetical protein
MVSRRRSRVNKRTKRRGGGLSPLSPSGSTKKSFRFTKKKQSPILKKIFSRKYTPATIRQERKRQEEDADIPDHVKRFIEAYEEKEKIKRENKSRKKK